jgi:HIV Tat-specific factor 1
MMYIFFNAKLEPDGVMVVKFKKHEAAAACVKVMDGRAFYPHIVEAYISTGREKFQRSRNNDEEDEERRHLDYGDWLDSQTLDD